MVHYLSAFALQVKITNGLTSYHRQYEHALEDPCIQLLYPGNISYKPVSSKLGIKPEKIGDAGENFNTLNKVNND